MQFLTNAIVTTLVVFLLLLPSFIVLRIFWGKSRGAINSENIYSYLVWGLPLSILIYLTYYKCFISSADFPKAAIWNLFADNSNKIDSADGSIKKTVTYIVLQKKDLIYKTTLSRAKLPKQSYDTVKVINLQDHKSSPDSIATFSYVISKNSKYNSAYSLFNSRRLIDSLTHLDTVYKSPNDYPKIDLGAKTLFISKRYLIKHFFCILWWCFFWSQFFRFLILSTGADRFDTFRLESALHYRLSGRQQLLDKNKKLMFSLRAPFKTFFYRVQVDLLCEIGDKMKIYRGTVIDFLVKDECVLYIVLNRPERGNLSSERSDLKNKKHENENVNLDLAVLSINENAEVHLGIESSQISAFKKILFKPIDYGNSEKDLRWTPIGDDNSGIMYFSHDEIKNIHILYDPPVDPETKASTTVSTD